MERADAVSVDPYEVALTVIGVAALTAAWVPAFTQRRAVSLPMVLVALGAIVFVVPLGLPDPDPRRWLEGVERVTEFVVIVSLMGAGLSIDRPFGWRRWATTWRLLVFAMPITILLVGLAGSAIAGLGLAAAALLGAVLAPTDPVLASEVQVGEPTTGEDPQDDAEEEVRFALTSEGGLNDALAFPFVYLAIVLAGAWSAEDLLRWAAWDLVGRIAIGAVVGLVVGVVLGRIAFEPPGPLRALSETPQGFVVIAATLLSYGVAELCQGYGFLAVFVAAVAIRSSEHRNELHGHLHGFAQQTENLTVAALLVLFGGALVHGVLDGFRWQVLVVVLVVVFVIRPLSGWIALAGSPLSGVERSAVAFFGIRGFGSVYYLAYALTETDIDGADTLWAIVASTILASIVVHGTLATPMLRLVDRAARERVMRRAQRPGTP